MSDSICTIVWTKDDIRQLLEDHEMDCSPEAVEACLQKLDLRYFEEACIQAGWERLASIID